MKKYLLPLLMALFVLAGCGTTTDPSVEDSDIGALTEGQQIEEVEQTTSPDTSIEEVSSVETDDAPDLDEIAAGESETNEKTSSSAQTGDMRVHFIDVGQGDGMLIETVAGNILVDAGNWNGRQVLDYLLKQQITHLDLVIATHPDADHIGQLPLILNQLTVNEIWMNGVESTSKTFENTIDIIDAKNIAYYEPEVGDGIDFGDVAIDVLGPITKTGDANRDSIVVKVTHGANALLLTGDAGVKEEQALITRFGHELESDILKLGHHGSNTSTSQAFLNAVKPSIAIVSASANNSYGHPHADVLARVIQAKMDVYQTSKHGDIVFQSDGKVIELIKAKEYTTRPEIQKESVPKEEASAKVDAQETAKQPVSKDALEGCVDINSASKEALMTIIHIGDVRAEELIRLRPFSSVDSLTRINGIGSGRLKDIKAENKACVR